MAKKLERTVFKNKRLAALAELAGRAFAPGRRSFCSRLDDGAILFAIDSLRRSGVILCKLGGSFERVISMGCGGRGAGGD